MIIICMFAGNLFNNFKEIIMRRILFVLLSSISIISCTIDFTKKDTEKKEIYGKVIEKYKDESNHMEPTIIYENKNGEFKYQVSDWAIKSDFWEYLQTGDSVIKPSGVLTLRVKKKNGDYIDYKYQR